MSLNILFVGDLNKYGRSYFRYITLVNLGLDVESISYVSMAEAGKIARNSFIQRVLWKLKVPFSDNGSNSLVKSSVQNCFYDIIWIEKGITFYPWTILQIKKLAPKSKIILFSEDDLCVSHGLSLWLLLSFRLYDFIATTKEHNLPELRKLGAKRVLRIADTYCELLHRPMKTLDHDLDEFTSSVSAIGAYEASRANTLEFLASNGITITVWGSDWEKHKTSYPDFLIIKNRFLFQDEYVRAICGSLININFLRKANRDSITSRSIEVPACGGFMIAERTKQHLLIFNEGVEAEFFSSNEELLLKIQYYLANPSKAKIVAKNGFLKVKKLNLDMRFCLNNLIENVIRL